MIMQSVEGMTYAKNRNLEVVDIEGLREFANNDPKALLSCRGVFVFTSGPRIPAAFIRKTNVAGDIIYSFSPE